MVAGIVPAAGRSRRMGRPKPLLPFGDGTVLGAVLEALRRGGVGVRVVVTRPGDAEIERLALACGARVAVNRRPDEGMLSSVVAGIDALGGAEALARERTALVVCPADLPTIPPAVVRRLLAALQREEAVLAVPVHRGRRGHPLAVAAGLVAEIPGLDPAVGLRQILDRHAGRTVEVEAGTPAVLRDLDTPADYARWGGAGS